MKNKLFILLVVLIALPSTSYAKTNIVTSCEGLNSVYEDLNCVDASTTGPICDPSEDIISLARGKSQLCCCLRVSDSANAADPSIADPSNPDTGLRKH